MRAFVIPVDMAEPGRIVEWDADGKLLDLLHRETGCDCIDKSPELSTPYGSMAMWVDDEGLLADPIAHNDRALGLARAVGWMTPDLAGPVVITGGHIEDGTTLGLSEELLAAIERGVAAATTGGEVR